MSAGWQWLDRNGAKGKPEIIINDLGLIVNPNINFPGSDCNLDFGLSPLAQLKSFDEKLLNQLRNC